MVTNRWLFVISVCGITFITGDAHPGTEVLAIASITGLTVSAPHLGLRGSIRVLAMLELSCAAAALGWFSFIGLRVAAATLGMAR
jgi:hypothetical protein